MRKLAERSTSEVGGWGGRGEGREKESRSYSSYERRSRLMRQESDEITARCLSTGIDRADGLAGEPRIVLRLGSFD